ncbi:hypothetical protein BGX34_007371, partial [Mortierella sp. NVP85]
FWHQLESILTCLSSRTQPVFHSAKHRGSQVMSVWMTTTATTAARACVIAVTL